LVLSPRLERRVRQEFSAESADEVLDRLDAAQFDSERVQAAVILAARGDEELLIEAIGLARADWRDVLIAGGLAHEDWPERVTVEFGPDD
jgi:hypothetical protein